ncbi:META domain-containing protein [Haloechinothrix salitolerans]|uniref:META domain-containing protein n=1 Tax=Haloechinothrix salitolerans TaxID=926830 RepID=A0ABW2C614_9PSEU
MRALLSMTLLAAVAAAIGGCGNQGGAEPADPPERLPVGQEFLSTEVTESGQQRPLVKDTRIRLSFAEGELRFSAGCNSFFGDARLAAGELVVEDLRSTEMGCAKPLMRQDDWLARFFTSGPSWQRDGDTLTLTSEDTTITLERQVAEPDKSLRGTRWQLDTIIDGATASSAAGDMRAHLVFHENGQVRGNAGCNQLTARYERDGGRIEFSRIVTTRKACGQPHDRIEQAVLTVLESSPRMEVEANRLTLTAESGKGLRFVAGD